MDYINYRQVSVIHMGNDELCHWWNARSQSHVRVVAETTGELTMEADCRHESGMMVKLGLSTAQPAAVTCDGETANFEIRWEFGRHWLFVIVPPGRHDIAVKETTSTNGGERYDI